MACVCKLKKLRIWRGKLARGVQLIVAEVLSDMDAEIATLKTRRDKTRLLKQAMMEELLTRRTRLA